MLSEDIFHQRGITLLYRTSNLIIQSVLYGKFPFLITILCSRLVYALRDLCVTFPDLNMYHDVSYLMSFWTFQFNQSVSRKGLVENQVIVVADT